MPEQTAKQLNKLETAPEGAHDPFRHKKPWSSPRVILSSLGSDTMKATHPTEGKSFFTKGTTAGPSS